MCVGFVPGCVVVRCVWVVDLCVGEGGGCEGGARGGSDIYFPSSIPTHYTMCQISDSTWLSAGNSWIRMALFPHERWALLRNSDLSKKQLQSIVCVWNAQIRWLFTQITAFSRKLNLRTPGSTCGCSQPPSPSPTHNLIHIRICGIGSCISGE